jgi:hypothetical protein
MRVVVRRLRHRGRRLSDHDIANAPDITGKLHTGEINRGRASYTVAMLRDPRNQVAGQLVPDLYEPTTVMIGSGGFVLGGLNAMMAGQR